ncbi:sugar (Glycoside-Pentoside-Hexuronide) transporter [Desulfitobacterium hafniense DCB-2]|uniref:Sugar (Glycoside-Pentoside-Hexuronide) transporter n=1 Tax=Desulfitobacterium hafniense (strain DSM 10664 / DCB-2) TaxID=272564 RepID=B8FTG7_DESHD|nr:glycoside-pentoside-hexuronide (GPH):cation symporter [Desulfitobacterium hafniense]ACL20401.1 sugar (Glycoside-Pentoside-Hexuronide) transporter [Desulfitobacterium hafniense DCB-2]
MEILKNAETVSPQSFFDERVAWREKAAYAMGDVGANVVWATLTSFMTFFFTDVAGIGAAAVGSIFLISRILDAFSDVGMGVLVDRTNHKYDKARPWLLWVAIPYGIGAVLLFSVPDFGMTGKIIYAFLTYNLMSTVLYTVFAQPYHTLMALMTRDQYQRSLLTVMRMFAGVCTAIVINNATLPLVEHFGGGAGGWQKTMAVYGAIAAVIIILVFLFTKERIRGVSAKKTPVREGLKALAANKYWLMILVVGVLVYILFALPGVNIYYARYVLGNPMYLGSIMTCTFVPNLLCFAAIPLALKIFSKRMLVFIGFLFYAIGTGALLVEPMNINYVLTGVFIKGLGFAPLAGTLYAFIADTIEYGEWKTGLRMEGLIMSAASFGQKVGTGIGLAIIGWLLAWGNYVGNAATQSPEALCVISFMFIQLPLCIYAAIIAIMYFYKLDREYPAIIAELNQRRS